MNAEAGKSEINLDLTSRKLNTLSDLATISNKQAVKILNLWENNIADASPLIQFTQIQELYIRDNQLTSIDSLKTL